MNISIPGWVLSVMEALEEQNFQAYLVGGCVRDSLLGMEPADWDVASDANPEELEKVFSQWKHFDAGIKHGTLSVLSEGKTVEVTSFRKDGPYSDRRHPDSVSFGQSLRADLRRRDFTVNAMAYSPRSGFADFAHGLEDLREGIIRCVGDPDIRFHEDALRVMRALRFAAQLNFRLHPDTAQAIIRCAHLLADIAPQRIAKELDRLILSPSAGEALTDYPQVLPFISRHLTGLSSEDMQNLRAHLSDCPPLLPVRLCFLFLHSPDTDGDLRRLGYAKALMEEVKQLQKLCLNSLPDDRISLKHLLRYYGVKVVSERIQMEIALGGNKEQSDLSARLLTDIIHSKETFTLDGLAIGGIDLLNLGMKSGPEIGLTLNRLLEIVMEYPSLNQRSLLLSMVKRQ